MLCFVDNINGPAHKILVLIVYVYAQMPLINAHADVFKTSKARGLYLCLELPLHSYFEHARNEGSLTQNIYLMGLDRLTLLL